MILCFEREEKENGEIYMEHRVSFSADTGVYAFGSGDLAKKQMMKI